jgi:hypothetical protein
MHAITARTKSALKAGANTKIRVLTPAIAIAMLSVVILEILLDCCEEVSGSSLQLSP